MKPAPFGYERPHELKAMLSVLAEANGSAKIIAGGQSLVARRFVARIDSRTDDNARTSSACPGVVVFGAGRAAARRVRRG